MKTQHLLIAVGVVIAALLLVSLRNRPAVAPGPQQTSVANGPQQAAEPQATGPQTAWPQVATLANQQGSSLRKADASGSTWSLDLTGGQSFEALASNGAKAGAPIVVKTDVQRSGDREVAVGLRLEGQAGELYRPVVKKDGVQVAAPALRIVNEAGKVIAQDTFKYG